MSYIINNLNNQNQDLLQPNLQMAERFLTLLSQCDESDNSFAFQTFSDKKDKSDLFAEIFIGSLEKHKKTLIDSNLQGSGIFVTINQTDGKGRKTENITKARAFFIDVDEGSIGPILNSPINPHITIESSPGKYHAYWIVEGCDLKSFSFIQKELIQFFQSDPKVHDLPRVMRLPGFFHHKEEPFQTKILDESREQPIPFQKFLDAFKITLPTHQKLSNQINPISSKQENPVLKALEKHSFLIEKQTHPQGCWTIQCPWFLSHSKEDKGTKYYEPNTNGYPEHGFKCFHDHCKDKTIKDLKSFLGLQKAPSIEIQQPLFRPIVPSAQFPIKALTPLLENAVATIHRVVGAPLNLCAQSVLGCAGLVTQPFLNVTVDGRIYPLSLYMISVGESGERKTGIDNVVLDPVRAYEKEMIKEYEKDLQQFKNENELYEKNRKNLLNDENADMAIFDTLTPPPKAPLDPIMIVPEPTFPALIVHLAKSVPSIGLFSSEGGQLIGGYAMKEENILNSAAGFSSLWDKGEINRARVKDGVYNLYGKRVGLNLMIQPIVAEKFFSNQTLLGQGFLSRCLICWPESTIGNRPYKKENVFEDESIKNFQIQTRKMLDFQKPFIENDKTELNPTNFPLVDEGYEHWVAFHNEVEEKMLPDGEYSQIKAFASKIPDNALRIAGILFGFNYGPDLDGLKRQIIPSLCIENSIEIAKFYLSEALRIYGINQIESDLIEAQKLLDWISGKKLKTFPTQYIYQHGPNSIRSAKKAKSLLKILKDHGWIKGPEKGEWEEKKHKELWTLTTP